MTIHIWKNDSNGLAHVVSARNNLRGIVDYARKNSTDIVVIAGPYLTVMFQDSASCIVKFASETVLRSIVPRMKFCREATFFVVDGIPQR
jgi:hypothetical protein